VSFTFRCALIFVDTYAHTLFLEVNFVFQKSSKLIIISVIPNKKTKWEE